MLAGLWLPSLVEINSCITSLNLLPSTSQQELQGVRQFVRKFTHRGNPVRDSAELGRAMIETFQNSVGLLAQRPFLSRQRRTARTSGFLLQHSNCQASRGLSGNRSSQQRMQGRHVYAYHCANSFENIMPFELTSYISTVNHGLHVCIRGQDWARHFRSPCSRQRNS